MKIIKKSMHLKKTLLLSRYKILVKNKSVLKKVKRMKYINICKRKTLYCQTKVDLWDINIF